MGKKTNKNNPPKSRILVAKGVKWNITKKKIQKKIKTENVNMVQGKKGEIEKTGHTWSIQDEVHVWNGCPAGYVDLVNAPLTSRRRLERDPDVV